MKDTDLDEILDKFAEYLDHDEYHYDCDTSDGHVEFNEGKAKAAILKWGNEQRADELRQLSRQHWQTSIPEQTVLDRIKALSSISCAPD